MLARLADAEELVADLRAGRTGALSIAYFASVGAAWLPQLVGRLSRDFPDVRLELRLSEDAPDDPDGRADVHLVVARDELVPGAGFRAHHLLDDPYVVVVPESHPLANGRGIELPDLVGERWIDNDFARGWCRRILLDACAAAGYAPQFHVEAHDYRAAIAFVAAGIGVTVLPALGASDPPSGVVVLPLVRPTPVRSIHAVVRESVALTPPARAAMELLRAAAARTRGLAA